MMLRKSRFIHQLALGDDRVMVFRPDNCSVTVFDVENGKLRLVERGHEAETKVN